jgi:hypothetical protein
MAKFRKKPVVIEAVQWDGSASTANAFIGEGFGVDWWYEIPIGERPGEESLRIVIPTLEGNHIGDIGDWIIKGVKGEFYPCKPDIFAATYEPA